MSSGEVQIYMKVYELIKELKGMPKDANVYHLWDGELRTEIQHVWLSRGGDVVTADNEQVCYSTESRPCEAPTSKQSSYWKSPKNRVPKNGLWAKIKIYLGL
jgi:hypothetical protein